MAGTIVTTVQKGTPRGVVRTNIALTCSGGAVSAQTIGKYFGRLVGIFYEPTAGDGATMTSTADVLITDHKTGASLIADLAFGTARYERPSMPVQDDAGTVITPATSAPDCRRDIFVAGELDIAIANATTTDTGYIGLVFEEGV